jgi:hypothetical protein
MDESNTSNVVMAAKELGEAYEETASLLAGFAEGVHETSNLYGSGNQGAGAALVSLGITLIAIPEPTLISDVIGCGIVGAGIAYQRFVLPPLSVADIYSSIENQVMNLRSSSQMMTSEMVLTIDPKKSEPR